MHLVSPLPSYRFSAIISTIMKITTTTIISTILMITQWHKSVGTVPGGEIGCGGACFTITDLTRFFLGFLAHSKMWDFFPRPLIYHIYMTHMVGQELVTTCAPQAMVSERCNMPQSRYLSNVSSSLFNVLCEASSGLGFGSIVWNHFNMPQSHLCSMWVRHHQNLHFFCRTPWHQGTILAPWHHQSSFMVPPWHHHGTMAP